MVRNFSEIYLFQIDKNDLKYNPPQLEKFLKFTSREWLQMIGKMVGKFFEIYLF